MWRGVAQVAELGNATRGVERVQCVSAVGGPSSGHAVSVRPPGM